MELACERLKAIEARLGAQFNSTKPSVDDARWMFDQIRGWQKFAKNVIAYGDVLRAIAPNNIALLEAYEKMFRTK